MEFYLERIYRPGGDLRGMLIYLFSDDYPLAAVRVDLAPGSDDHQGRIEGLAGVVEQRYRMLCDLGAPRFLLEVAREVIQGEGDVGAIRDVTAKAQWDWMRARGQSLTVRCPAG